MWVTVSCFLDNDGEFRQSFSYSWIWILDMNWMWIELVIVSFMGHLVGGSEEQTWGLPMEEVLPQAFSTGSWRPDSSLLTCPAGFALSSLHNHVSQFLEKTLLLYVHMCVCMHACSVHTCTHMHVFVCIHACFHLHIYSSCQLCFCFSREPWLIQVNMKGYLFLFFCQ